MSDLDPIQLNTDYVLHYTVVDRINKMILVNNAVRDDNVVRVREPSDLSGQLDSTKLYLITTAIDMTGTGISINVPSGGLNIIGYTFGTSSIICSDDNYSLFTSINSGTLFISDVAFTVTGLNSEVYNLKSATGFDAVEIKSVNYIDCISLGVLDNFRQLLEVGTGRIGGTPELTFKGAWSGARISTSIALNLSNFTSLFKAGDGLVFTGRFTADINCDLPTSGSLIDFSESNIFGEESLIFKGAFITRDGVINTSDPAISPNISQDNVKSLWSDNTGIPNTYKYIKGVISTPLPTTITNVNEYYPLAGTFTVQKQSHFDSPSNGEFRLLSGNGTYRMSGDIIIEGNANHVVDIAITKSTDDGLTYPIELNHIQRVINNLSGGRDIAFFPINFTEELKKGDRVRIEVENKTTGNTTLTAELDSDISIIAL